MSEPIEDDIESNRDTDVPPEKPVPAGFYTAVVAGVQIFDQGAEDKPYPGCRIARITYRLDSDDPDLDGKRIQPWPIPIKGDKDSWRWFDWCGRMGYNTTGPFRFSSKDVEGIRVNLEFGPPRAGTGKHEGKLFDNLTSVSRLSE